LIRGNLTGTGEHWANTGILASSGSLQLILQSLTNSDGGLFYSLGDTRFLLDTFTTTEADLYVGGNFTLARDIQGDTVTAASALHNRSGSIEIVGDARIAAETLTNERRVLEVDTRKISARLTNNHCTSSSNCGGTNRFYDVTLEETERTEITATSAPSWLIVGGSLEIVEAALKNSSSLIAVGGDIHIQGGSLDNRGVQPGELLIQRHLHTNKIKEWLLGDYLNAVAAFNASNWPQASGDIETQISRFISQRIDQTYNKYRYLDSTTFLPAENSADYSGIIQSGGDITTEGVKIINQGVQKPHYTLITGGRTEDGSLGSQITVDARLAADLTRKLTDPSSLPSADRPSKLYRPAPGTHPYLFTRAIIEGRSAR
ncbi:MAG: hypothetical protein LBP58_03290, partial [Azoarcus sp.]|nr:hypothetical protein [Azoarcus sp.]